MSISAMKQALEALESWQKTCLDVGRASDELGRATKAIEPLRQAIAEAEKQEPVAWLSKYTNDDNKTIGYTLWKKDVGEGCFPVYTAPPKREWVGLTDEEILEIPFLELVEGIQAKLKEKNT